uniref:Uncharacterized protein n=1 Tax=Arion vulgaris TaxID=1028688 RepID=A0A0B6ZEQ4_9EUPU
MYMCCITMVKALVLLQTETMVALQCRHPLVDQSAVGYQIRLVVEEKANKEGTDHLPYKY